MKLLRVDDALHRELKAECARRGTTLTEATRVAVKAWLQCRDVVESWARMHDIARETDGARPG